jgi:hypothetical protein
MGKIRLVAEEDMSTWSHWAAGVAKEAAVMRPAGTES